MGVAGGVRGRVLFVLSEILYFSWIIGHIKTTIENFENQKGKLETWRIYPKHYAP